MKLPPAASLRQSGLRAGCCALGLIFTALGIIGAFLPLMPTTVFLILAAGCFTRSSPRLEGWLLTHPRYGSVLRAWRRERAVPRKAKIMACTGMIVSYFVFFVFARPPIASAMIVAIILCLISLWLISRPPVRLKS
jgi:uncharacterized membrane protein YbaN (DUF454 family)